jgi:ATP-dependent RNA helicase DDX23/PRP28
VQYQQYDPRRDRLQGARDRQQAPNDAPTGPRNGAAPVASSSSSAATSSASTPAGAAPVTEAEQALIRNRYLGIAEVHKKKTRRMLSDKRYMFTHDMAEDTSDRVNPELFGSSIEAGVFGAGGRAGMDPAQRGAITANG